MYHFALLMAPYLDGITIQDKEQLLVEYKQSVWLSRTLAYLISYSNLMHLNLLNPSPTNQIIS